MLDLKGKYILVTGASSGIGFETAIHLSKIGANLVITGRNPERLSECFSKLENNGHLQITADLRNTDDVLKIFEYIKSNDVRLDGMVHCAGISDVTPVKLLTKDRLTNVFETNFFSFIELVKVFCNKKYSNDNSSIVVLSSEVVRHPRMFELAYISSKAAIESSIPIIALEYKKRHIRINTLSIGYVKLGMTLSNMDKFNNEKNINELVERSIFGWSEINDICDVIAYLLSSRSKLITGKCISADGGIV